jgi:hypothetical protein
MIKEETLQLIWERGLFRQNELKTTCGKDVSILSAGTKNLNAGPDFFNAKIKIGKTIWAGNVEAHLRSSDWERHSHQLDGAYNNVILHVVIQEDSDSFTSLGRRVDTLLLDNQPFCREQEEKKSWLHCHHHIHTISNVRLRCWLTQLQGERLEGKCKYISGLRFSYKRNWEETLILALAAAMGQPLNSLPFELTLKGIPLDLLLENRDKLQNIEAILFGQAGFLNEKDLGGPYERDLYKNYSENFNKFRNGPIDKHMWKFLRLRPASFPTLRISQFASLIHTRIPLLESILDTASLPELEQLLRVESSSYWNTHYLFGKCSNELVKVLGHKTILGLIINGLVPFLFSYGHSMHHDKAILLGNRLLFEMEAESNQIINKWAVHGIKPIGAFESQALIHLHNAYCLRKRCCDCPLGAKQRSS